MAKMDLQQEAKLYATVHLAEWRELFKLKGKIPENEFEEKKRLLSEAQVGVVRNRPDLMIAILEALEEIP